MTEKNPPKQIAIFGSAFNPPSLGHLSVIQRLSHFDRVLLVPNYAHAWGKKMADFEKRCAWVTAFIQDAALDNIMLCSDERDIAGGEAVTTWALLNHLQNQYPTSELTFVLGPDNFLSFAKFHKSAEIMARWNILACPETVNVRSTHIRERLGSEDDVSSLTTPTLARQLTKKDFD
ncbi:nicotinate-nicotinamide nucleotide adenylyltransferase [Enterovibrio baiacu]|uniref:nicotinate-nicotinamide nucleotide adenylyltransferase n=1 Tax=Enterovibrio baiacu TaxID=2491023 RepID=UPI0010124632|nr:nicotinate-nicotinamide nucleotide adenylyltransferase [Enterovibrio baiacu]MBE1273374.1 nicotinate-nicotinamide nucleotide adenylyltransferase [Enterovibrio baiacu]